MEAELAQLALLVLRLAGETGRLTIPLPEGRAAAIATLWLLLLLLLLRTSPTGEMSEMGLVAAMIPEGVLVGFTNASMAFFLA